MNINVSQLPDDLKKLTLEEVNSRIITAKKKLSDNLLILGHHYQEDGIIEHADQIGDSFALAKIAANSTAKYIVFCGVYFMAETADAVTTKEQYVFCPNVEAGCYLADCADIMAIEKAWADLKKITDEKVIPITYMNSSLALKAFCGKNDGIVCTSSNAENALKWAWKRGEKVFFFPDQHLGRNTAYKMNVSLDEIVLWDKEGQDTSIDKNAIINAKIILWDGCCDVHQEFRAEKIDELRRDYPEIRIIAHPECNFEVVRKSDDSGSTTKIIDVINNSKKDSIWGVGTEKKLVERLQKLHHDKKIFFLQDWAPECKTMSMITPAHLMYQLENLVDNNLINRISVDANTAKDAMKSINRMLEL